MRKRIFSIFVCCMLVIGLVPVTTFAEDTQPSTTGTATIVLVNNSQWDDGSGYQILLDADHNTYGTVIPEAGQFCVSADNPEEKYAHFEYKIPAAAEGIGNTKKTVAYGDSESLVIPAGTYDYVITYINPTYERIVWIVGTKGDTPTRYDDYVFEAGKTYTFTTRRVGDFDGVFLVITEPHKHTYGAWSHNETEHWRECTDPNCQGKDDSVIDKAPHSAVATCTEAAVCVCGVELGGKDPDNHSDLRHVDAKKATKSAEGNIEYWYCEGCGKYYSDEAATTEITEAETVIAKLSNGTKNPQTSDVDNMTSLFVLLAAIGGASAIAVVAGKKRKYNR